MTHRSRKKNAYTIRGNWPAQATDDSCSMARLVPWPGVMAVAKGIASGMPLGASVARAPT